MTSSVHPSSQPDYFPFVFTAENWEMTLEQLEKAPAKATLCLSEESLATAGKIYTLWQKIKSFFGFEDLTDEVKVGAFLAKFMYQGAKLGYSKTHETRIDALHGKMDASELRVHQDVKDFFNFDAFTQLPESELQQKVVAYFEANKERMQPSYWNRQFSQTIYLPANHLFGRTHLELAKKLEWTHPNGSAEHCLIAAQLGATQDPIFIDNHRVLFDHFVKNSFHYFPAMGATDLILAERLFCLDNHAESNRQFKRAADHKIPFSEKQKVYYLRTSGIIEDYNEALTKAGSINLSGQPVPIKEIYTRTMIGLGDFYASKIHTVRTRVFRAVTLGFTPAPVDHARRAIKFYDLGLAASSHEQSLRQLHQHIHEKKLNLAVFHPIADSSSSSSVPSGPLVQIYDHLREMKIANPIDNLAIRGNRQSIAALTRCILAFYSENTERECLELIEKALQFIGDIGTRFYITRPLFSRGAPKITCATPNLVTPQNMFTLDVGASLHFLKAEILRKQFGDTVEVYQEYKLAVNLAPENPFGAEALLLKDDQETPSNMLNGIDSYRALAIEWGSADLKEFIAHQL